MIFLKTRRNWSGCLQVGLLAGVVVCVGMMAGCLRGSASQQLADAQQAEVTIPVEADTTAKQSDEGTMSEKLKLSEEDWKARLSPQQYYVLREKGTERPFTNEFDEHFEPGTYSCAACGTELFTSETKFNSGCGWPAFYAAKAGDKVELHRDLTHGMIRTEVTCAHCDSHLGHVFDDAPQTPTGQRFCINSVSLKFTPQK